MGIRSDLANLSDYYKIHILSTPDQVFIIVGLLFYVGNFHLVDLTGARGMWATLFTTSLWVGYFLDELGLEMFSYKQQNKQSNSVGPITVDL